MTNTQDTFSAFTATFVVPQDMNTFLSIWDQSRSSSELIKELHDRFLQAPQESTDSQPALNKTGKKRGKSMSRRRGQRGHIEKNGLWWVVRVWQDVPGQDKRKHVPHRICPIKGPGTLNKSERRRKADQIIADLGINSEEVFDTIVNPAQKKGEVTFREQGKIALEALRTRLRNPAADGSVENLERNLRLHLNPILGDMLLSKIYSPQLRPVVHKMVKEKKTPSTISCVITMAKAVVASATDPETGEVLYPRKWNSQIIDLPVVISDEQDTPDFSRETLTGLAAYRKPKMRALFQFLGASGTRITEALGIEIDKHISPDFLTFTIDQKANGPHVSPRLKTPAARRQVDIHSDIGAVLKKHAGNRTTGFLFCTSKGTPFASSYVLRHLHKALKELGWVNEQNGKTTAGEHAFRRSRDTYLLNKAGCPNGIVKFWLGHAFGKNMQERYDKIKRDTKCRRMWAETCGYDFDLPLDVPIVPKQK